MDKFSFRFIFWHVIIPLAIGFALWMYPKSASPASTQQMDTKSVRYEWVKHSISTHYQVEDKRLVKTIVSASSEYDVPIELLTALIGVESTYNHRAVSSEGAIGYGQIIPEVWDGVCPHNIYDKYENVYCSAYVLNDYYQITGNWEDTVKAYNIGITNKLKNRKRAAANRYYQKITTTVMMLVDT